MKIQFHQEHVQGFEESVREIGQKWRDHLARFAQTTDEVNDRYDSLILQLETTYSSVSSALSSAKQTNRSLSEERDQQKSLKTKLQNRNETTQLEIGAEIDLELRLQQRVAELHLQLGESQRRLECQVEKKVRLKKAYIRAINQYKRLKAEEELRENRRRAFEKRALLERKKKEREEEERRAREAGNDPRNKYMALLAAAGHIDGDPLTTKPDQITFYQGAVLPGDAASRGEQIIVDSPKLEEGIWLENNIRTLLSTGNYTDDDPVIRGLWAQLQRIRSAR
jgi:hypothetical protein